MRQQQQTVPEARNPLQQKTLTDVCGPLSGDKAVDPATFDRLGSRDDAGRHVSYFTSGQDRSLVLNCSLYSEGE